MSVAANAATRWALTDVSSSMIYESRSASTVARVHTVQGTSAYLKATPVGAGPTALAAARRELAFYRHVASGLPGVAPQLLETHEDEEGLALLLEDAGGILQATEWDETQWKSLATTIHRVHGADVEGRPEFSHPTELDTALVQIGSGVANFWVGVIPALADVLDVLRWKLPNLLVHDAFVHGDLHIDNVICASDGNTLRISDWQQCGMGAAIADLAFVNVRLSPSGRTSPDSFLEAYAAVSGDELDELRRSVAFLELATYVLVWPPFAAYNSPAGIAAVQSRAAELARSAMTDAGAA